MACWEMFNHGLSGKKQNTTLVGRACRLPTAMGSLSHHGQVHVTSVNVELRGDARWLVRWLWHTPGQEERHCTRTQLCPQHDFMCLTHVLSWNPEFIYPLTHGASETLGGKRIALLL